jgi:hypothetical protein
MFGRNHINCLFVRSMKRSSCHPTWWPLPATEQVSRNRKEVNTMKITVKRVEAIKATRIHLTDNCLA